MNFVVFCEYSRLNLVVVEMMVIIPLQRSFLWLVHTHAATNTGKVFEDNVVVTISAVTRP